MDTPHPSALPLYEAICAWGEQQIVSEMLELESWGGSPVWFFDGSEYDRKKGRYLHLREKLEHWLVDRLLRGDFVSWGYDEYRPLDGIKPIPKGLWRILEANFTESSATAGARKIIGILVAPPEGTLLAPQVRLVINLRTEEIWLDGEPARLANRARALLIILAAKAAHDGAGPMPSREIQPRLPNSKSDSAVGHAAYTLRQQLKQYGHNADGLVQNQSGRGYFLQLRPEEIQIRS